MPPKKSELKKKKERNKEEVIEIDKKNNGKKRCEYVFIVSQKKQADLMKKYHDKRWCKPLHEDNELFAMLILETMQAGLSWLIILEKEENYRKAFDKLNPVVIAKYTSKKIEKLMQNPGIIRNRRKILSVINNAKAFLKVQKEFGTFDKYIWSFTDRKIIDHHLSKNDEMPAKTELSEKISKDLKKRGFQFVGPIIIYSYLQAIGIVNDHYDYCDYR